MKLVIFSSKKLSYIDTSTTGVSYYDDFLTDGGLNYLQSRKNRTGEILYMSSNEYFKECANKIFNTPLNHLIASRRMDKDTLNWMYSAINSGKSFKLPYINYADSGQEGLHRMMALGDTFGWDTKYPVLVITIYDERREEVDHIYKYLYDAVNEAKEYSYPADKLVEYFKSQVEFEIQDYFHEDENYDILVSFNEQTEVLRVSVVGYEDDIQIDLHISQLRISEPDDSSTDDLSDIDELLDLEDLEIYF